MPGYYETYLHGLNQAIPMARLAETERQNAFLQNYRVRALQAQEAQREANQRRLEAGMEETRRHHGETERGSAESRNIALQGLVQRLQQQLTQGSYDLKEDSEGNQWAYDKRNNRMMPVGGGGQETQPASTGPAPTMFNAPRALPAKERSNLEGLGSNMQELLALAKSFKPEYTNALGPQIGALENIAKQYVPGTDSAQPNFWRQYERLSQIPERHKAFGAALTARETPAWAKGEINVGMKPDDIIKALNIRAALLQRATHRAAKSSSMRYNKREVEAALGQSVPKELPQDFPDLEGLANEGARVTGQGRPPLEELLR